MNTESYINSQLSKFSGVYMSGFYIKNPATITSLALLFDKIYIPNNLEIVTGFSEKFILDPEEEIEVKLNFERIELDGTRIDDNPLKHLSPTQRTTAEKYLLISQAFCMNNHELFPTVFQTDLFETGEPMTAKLVKKGAPGELNKYEVSANSMQVTTEGTSETLNLIKKGAIPIVTQEFDNPLDLDNSSQKASKNIAALLAMKSVEMMLPPFKTAKPQEILEARDRLSDQLPAFWSSMLKFSVDAKQIISEASTIDEAILECSNIVDTTIRPTLIDLNNKILKDRKNWFYRIVNPIGNGIKLLIGKPSITQADLIASAMSLSTNMALDYMSHKQKIEALKEDSGLTYLLKLGELMKHKK